jgi:hypothetical protein
MLRKSVVSCLAAGGLAVLAGGVSAEIGTIDDVPAATLLLPYFEVDLDDPDGVNTLFSINNASASAAVAHVTVWSDLSVPVLDFDVYLTGFDVQTLSLRDVLNGKLPLTADAGADSLIPPGDTISPQGPLSQDINFPGASGPCAAPAYGPLTTAFVFGHLHPALTGTPSTIAGCVSADHGDVLWIARGYVTVDSVTTCNLDFPSTPGYFTGIADFRNILYGDYFQVHPAEGFAQGETLVHIEACQPGNGYVGNVGNGAGNCPFGLGDFTFYSRYVGDTGIDQREGLASQFAVRYLTGGVFTAGTDFVVWRDSRSTDIVGGACPAENNFVWYPLNQDLVVAFDEQENAEELCFLESDVSPPTGGQQTCFPIETGRYNVASSAVPGSQSLDPTFEFGWMFLDLDLSSVQRSQAWVSAAVSAEGRFSVGFDAVRLDSVTETSLVVVPGLQSP